MHTLRVSTIWFLTSILSLSAIAAADVVEWFGDRDEWEAAVGGFTTVDFTGYPHGTPVSDQWAHLGVTFEGNVIIHESSLYHNDGFGLFGSGGAWVHFHSYMDSIAADFAGLLAFALYDDNELVAEIGLFGGGGTGFFVGLISEIPFNKVYLFRPEPFDNLVFIDDLHFGALVVPAPGALALFGLALAFNRRRRGRQAPSRPGRL
jgi:hypothetical protein